MAHSSMEQVSVKLPPAFDATRHHGALVKLIAQKHGDGFEVQHIDPVLLVAVATRQVAITEVTAATKTKDSFEVRLARGTTMGDGDKTAAKLEDQNPGYYLTGFEPFLGKATLTKMPDAQARCRGAVSVALGVKPWDVKVTSRRDGGYDLVLPKSYVPSKHDDKLHEVASVIVGEDGWYVDVNTQQLTASIIPSAPPTFPEVLPTPMASLGADPDRTPIGLKLPRPGQELGEPIAVDWAASAHLMLAGVPGAGKRHPLGTRVPVPASERHPSGWTTIGGLQIGDDVFSAAGDVVQVDYLSPIVDRDIYRVTFSDGQVVEADREHLWTVSTFESRGAHNPTRLALSVPAAERRREKVSAIRATAEQACRDRVGATSGALQTIFGTSLSTVYDVARKAGVPYVVGPGGSRAYAIDEFAEAWIARIENRYATPAHEDIPLLTTVTTADLLAHLAVPDGRTNYAVPVAGALELADADLPVDPYLFGAWLGDGTSRAGAITIGPADLEWMKPSLEAAWGRAAHRTQTGKGTTATTLFFGRPDTTLCKQGHNEWVPGSHGSDICRACLRNGGKAQYGPNCSLLERLTVLGVKQNKHIPAAYLRASRAQRLALLQGLMDTDGTVDHAGSANFTVTNERLASDVLELVRSLGIKARATNSPAVLVLPDPNDPSERIRRTTGTAYAVTFTTDQAVFRMPRKSARLPAAGTLSSASAWNYVVGVEKVASAPGRCLRVNTPSHLYLVEGFIPTHNTVTLNAMIADQLASGAALCLVDDVSKAIDFLWCKDFVRENGWGCDSDRAAVAALALVYAEGQRRAKVLGESGYVNWLDMPKGQRFQPIFVVVDEVSALLVTDKIPSGVPKTHPLVQEMLESNLMKVQLASYISKIVAEMRFVGIRMVLSTQVTNNNTGVPPSLKAKIGGKLLAGANPSKSARVQAFSDETAVPGVPDNVKAGGKRARGVGAADLEGQAPAVYKSYFASTQDYRAHLERLGVPKTSQPAPTAFQIAKYTPSLDDDGSDDGPPPSRMDAGGFGAPDGRDDDGGPRLMGAAKAAHQLKVDAAAHAKALAQKRAAEEARASLDLE